MEGLTSLIGQELNDLPQSEFEKYIKILFELSQDCCIFGSCEHYLYIGRKPERHWSM
jgi:hypothetical protein